MELCHSTTPSACSIGYGAEEQREQTYFHHLDVVRKQRIYTRQPNVECQSAQPIDSPNVRCLARPAHLRIGNPSQHWSVETVRRWKVGMVDGADSVVKSARQMMRVIEGAQNHTVQINRVDKLTEQRA